MFNRSQYYSQTEATKVYKLSIKQFKQLIADHQIQQVNKDIQFEGYTVTTVYVLKAEIDKLNLPKRK